MSQTIVCEIVSEWEESGVMPEGVTLELLQECQQIMTDLGSGYNRLYSENRRMAKLLEKNNIFDFVPET